jgi:hypothetical protein
MRRVFISHRNSPAEVALLGALAAALRANGFDVLVDSERLRPGATWRNDIYTWLGICHAGIVLISPATLTEDSVWVPRESSILSWRKSLDSAFALVPVLLDGVTADDLRADLQFRDLGLHDLQCIVHESSEATCAAVLTGLATLPNTARSPLEELAEQVEALLGPVRDEFLDEAVQLTGIETRILPTRYSTARRLSLALLQVPFPRAVEALEYLATRVATATAIDRILDVIAPGWVDLSAARWVTYCAAVQGARPAAVVNATLRFTAEMYVRRATCRPPRTMWRVVTVTGVHGEMVFEDLATEISEALLAEFAGSLVNDPFAARPESQLVRLLQELNRRGRPAVVVVRLPQGAAELMPQLQERFSYLTFLFLSGETLPDEASCPITLLRRVEPALRPGEERAAVAEFETARTLLRA